jgi:hypothetical protein
MSLKTFHIVFIALAALLLFGFAVWCLTAGTPGVQGMQIAGGVASLIAGVGLLVYGIRFLKKFRHVSYL